MKHQLAQGIGDIFGKISPPAGMNIGGGDPIAALGKLLQVLINIFITLAALFTLIYLLWGAFDWIVSGGEKEKLQKAQNKITNAIIGLILIFVVLSIFGLLTGNILGIITNNGPNGWQLNIPTLK